MPKKKTTIELNNFVFFKSFFPVDFVFIAGDDDDDDNGAGILNEFLGSDFISFNVYFYQNSRVLRHLVDSLKLSSFCS